MRAAITQIKIHGIRADTVMTRQMNTFGLFVYIYDIYTSDTLMTLYSTPNISLRYTPQKSNLHITH